MAERKPDKPQIDKFKDAARELGVDESEEAFDERLRKLVKRLQTAPKMKKPRKTGA